MPLLAMDYAEALLILMVAPVVHTKYIGTVPIVTVMAVACICSGFEDPQPRQIIDSSSPLPVVFPSPVIAADFGVLPDTL
jgi:hypothetical protein